MAIDHGTFSRPARLAASLAQGTEEECAHLFLKKSVLIRLESAFGHLQDARETFLFAVNQVLRFCPSVGLLVPPKFQDLADRSSDIATAIHGADHLIRIVHSDYEAAAFDATINVGTAMTNELPWITVNSSGWLARVATASSGVKALPWFPASANACGSLAAACLGAGAAFLTILGPPPNISQEISLFSHQEA